MHQVCPASASKKPEFLTELPVAPSLAEGLAGEGQREESDLDSGSPIQAGHVPSLTQMGSVAGILHCSRQDRAAQPEPGPKSPQVAGNYFPNKTPLLMAQRVEKDTLNVIHSCIPSFHR